MAIDEHLGAALAQLGPKPPEEATQATKKRYSEQISNAAASVIAAELRARGLKDARPAAPGHAGASGAERRMAGGIGAKKVDVTWATEEAGLVLGVSVKSINWRDKKTGNFQKNLTNRRGDLLFESVTLHRRFPYAVLFGILFLDKDAAEDATAKRRSTFANAHMRLKLFTGRDDPAGRDEQYERLYVALLDANPAQPICQPFAVGQPGEATTWTEVIDAMLALVAERNPDFYEYADGKLQPAR